MPIDLVPKMDELFEQVPMDQPEAWTEPLQLDGAVALVEEPVECADQTETGAGDDIAQQSDDTPGQAADETVQVEADSAILGEPPKRLAHVQVRTAKPNWLQDVIR